MFMVEEDAENQCFIKAKRKGEPTFTLRAQDETSVRVIKFWLELNYRFLTPEKIAQTREDIKKFEAWPFKKQAD